MNEDGLYTITDNEDDFTPIENGIIDGRQT